MCLVSGVLWNWGEAGVSVFIAGWLDATVALLRVAGGLAAIA